MLFVSSKMCLTLLFKYVLLLVNFILLCYLQSLIFVVKHLLYILSLEHFGQFILNINVMLMVSFTLLQSINS